ncbi:MAG TPA: glycosyltransferase [Blastocatellia bacterium]|jgi:glycosyltransferase involved in cell wall biosynthesis|nr:glycosyltransferase [Blastocatellia bacterium]
MRVEPRVAFFPDSFVEVNGVAHTSRQMVAFAERRELPMLCVHGGGRTERVVEGGLTKLSLRRGNFGFRLDADFRHDLFFWRHAKRAMEEAREFRANVVHITGPNDTGQLGAYVAHRLRLPLVISWHTNLHEYAGRRLGKLMAPLPNAWRERLACLAERQSLRATLRFYSLGRALLAPNEELRDLLARETGRPTHLMRRGVDTSLFSPAKRLRGDSAFLIGYVGRLTPEKNVRRLAELERGLIEAGAGDFRFLIVGCGSEREWLERRMRRAEFTGVLRGEALARAYANLDLFVFPSQTDTFGNVVLEAQASGVPCLVSSRGGPKSIIQFEQTGADNGASGPSGIVADSPRGFLEAALGLMSQPERLNRMREAALARAREFSWESVFEQVYQTYEDCLLRIGDFSTDSILSPRRVATPDVNAAIR